MKLASPAPGSISDAISGRWMNIYVVVLVMMLVVPYATGAIAYAFNVSASISFRPMYYMLLVGSGLAACGLISPPRINVGILILVGLLGWRFLDAAVFSRSAAGIGDAAQLSGSSVFFVLCIWLASGYRNHLFQGLVLSGIAVVLIVAGLSIYEWRNPGQFSTVIGRSAGFIGNPNDSATIMALVLALLAVLNLRQLWLLPLSVIGGAGIYFTLSRGGIILFALFVVTYLGFTLRAQRWAILVTLGCAAALVLSLIAWLDFDPFISDRDVMRRVAAIRGQGIEDIDDTGRFTLLREGMMVFFDQPITGYGTGASVETFRPHNMVLGVAIDNGVLALCAYLVATFLLLHTAWRERRHRLIMLLPMMLTVFFSHNLLDNTTYLLCWLVCAIPIEGQLRGFTLMPVATMPLTRKVLPSDRRWLGAEGGVERSR